VAACRYGQNASTLNIRHSLGVPKYRHNRSNQAVKLGENSRLAAIAS